MPDDDNTTERPQVKPFAAWLQEQRGGLLHAELSDALADLAEAVVDTNKGGTLTLTVKVKPSKIYGAVEVEDLVKPKLPEAERDTALFYPDEHGNLSRRDPRQPEIPGVRDATADTTTARTGTEG